MKKIHAAVAILLLLATSAFADTYVVFLNGIANDKAAANESRIKLCETLKSFEPLSKKQESCNDNNESVKFVRLYNPTNGFGYDKAELAWQAAFSDDALARVQLIYPSLDVHELIRKPEYIEYLGDLYENKIANLKVSGQYREWNSVKDENEGNRRVIFEAADTFAEKFITKASEGHKIIVVSHSQGNFFAEAAFALIKKRNSSILNNIRFVGVASVAASTPSIDRYVSSKDDSTVFSIQTANYAASRPIIRNLDATLLLSGIYQPRKFNIETDSFDLGGHSFTNVYLGDGVKDKASGLEVKTIIVNHIKDAFNEINSTQPQFSTWLSWDGAKFTKDSITNVEGGIANAREFGSLIYRPATPLDGNNFTFEIKARWNSSAAGYSGRDIAFSFDNRFNSGQVDSANQPKITRNVQVNFRTNGWSDIITINSDAGLAQRFVGTTNTVAWHTYKVESYGGIVSVYVDGSLKYTHPYSGTVGNLDTFSATGLAGVAIDPTSFKISKFK